MNENIEIIPVGRAKNLINQKFGRLTVIGRAKSNDTRHSYWWCQCECGNYTKVRGDCLGGNTFSCGCYKQEKLVETGKELARKYNAINGRNNKIDLVGQRFGKLVVLQDSEERVKTGNGTQVVWICQCDCGNITKVPSGHLKSGHTTSCGCKKCLMEKKKFFNY